MSNFFIFIFFGCHRNHRSQLTLVLLGVRVRYFSHIGFFCNPKGLLARARVTFLQSKPIFSYSMLYVWTPMYEQAL